MTESLRLNHMPDVLETSSFNDYQRQCASLAMYPGCKKSGGGFAYLAGKYGGEAGETQEKVFKWIRDGTIPCDVDGNLLSCGDVSSLTFEQRVALAQELGDGLWYISEMARKLGFTLAQIAWLNTAKLSDRKDRGVLVGEGDNR